MFRQVWQNMCNRCAIQECRNVVLVEEQLLRAFSETNQQGFVGVVKPWVFVGTATPLSL